MAAGVAAAVGLTGVAAVAEVVVAAAAVGVAAPGCYCNSSCCCGDGVRHSHRTIGGWNAPTQTVAQQNAEIPILPSLQSQC